MTLLAVGLPFPFLVSFPLNFSFGFGEISLSYPGGCPSTLKTLKGLGAEVYGIIRIALARTGLFERTWIASHSEGGIAPASVMTLSSDAVTWAFSGLSVKSSIMVSSGKASRAFCDAAAILEAVAWSVANDITFLRDILWIRSTEGYAGVGSMAGDGGMIKILWIDPS
jgi:hypothetical protein